MTGVDDPRVEESTEYRRKMGRWRLDVRNIIVQPVFWLIVKLVGHSHEPLEAVFKFIDKKRNSAEIEMRGTGLAQLVCGMAQELLQGFDHIFKDFAWARTVAEHAPSFLKCDLLAFNVELWCFHGASFNRRVMLLLDKYPPTFLHYTVYINNLTWRTGRFTATQVGGT